MTTNSIFTSGMTLTDDELNALSIDVMAVWLDMWREARDQEDDELTTWLTEEALPTGSMSEWPEFAFEIFLTEEHDEPESYYEAIGIDDFDALNDR